MTKPADRVTLILRFEGGNNTVIVHEETRSHDTNGPFDIQETVAVQDLCDDFDRLLFELRSDGQTLMSARVPVSFSNAGICNASIQPGAHRQRLIRSGASAPTSRKLYTISGAYIGKAGERHANPPSTTGIFLSVDNKGRCSRVVTFRH